MEDQMQYLFSFIKNVNLPILWLGSDKFILKNYPGDYKPYQMLKGTKTKKILAKIMKKKR